MNYNIEISARFEKEITKLLKKFPSLKEEYAELLVSLKEHRFKALYLVINVIKFAFLLRLKAVENQEGQALSPTYIAETTVYLLSIYDKSDQESSSDKDILSIIKTIR